jgi:para-aminobenzoate synthetase component II
VILLIDNYDSFTWNLVHRLAEIDPSLRPQDIAIHRNDQISPDDAHALDDGRGPTHLIISPGPCSPAESGNSRALIRAFAGRIPILGVCLGHQCIADAFGMPVRQHTIPTHGKTCEVHHDGRGLYAGLPSPFTAARYHSLIVPEEAIADGWEVSAWTNEPTTHQRIVMGLRSTGAAAPIDGLQFHPESFMTPQGTQLLANFLAAGAVQAP